MMPLGMGRFDGSPEGIGKGYGCDEVVVAAGCVVAGGAVVAGCV